MDEESKKQQEFQRHKDASLNKKDLSLKGSIDEPIRELVEILNSNQYYYTTSTCSGRITLTEKPIGKSNIKKGNKFRLSSHNIVNYDQLYSAIEDYKKDCGRASRQEESCLWFKFEPYIMHIQCFDISKARDLLNIVMANGCRNSGVTFGNPNKFMLAVRSTSSMEVPIACDNKFYVDTNQLKFLCEEANKRLSTNLERLHRLQLAIKTNLDAHK